jgi:hypothetical protein
VESLGFRADLLRAIGIALIVLGGLSLIGVAVRLGRGERVPVGERVLTPGRIVAAVRGALTSVRRDRERDGWTPALVERAQVATRVAAACGLGRPVSQAKASSRGATAGAGILAYDWTRRNSRTVSSSVTAQQVASALSGTPASASAQASFEQLRDALSTFGVALYGRDGLSNEADLDQALEGALQAAGRVSAEHAWPRAWLRRRRTAASDAASELVG